MAIAFSLTPKGSSEPAVLQEVDDQMRLAFHVEPDKVNWYRHWYDLIGLAMAFGKDKTEILTLFQVTRILSTGYMSIIRSILGVNKCFVCTINPANRRVCRFIPPIYSH